VGSNEASERLDLTSGAAENAKADDARLVTRAASGDAVAFRELVLKHVDAVHRVVLGHVGPDEAEDATQEVFLRVHRGLKGFEGRSRVTTWLYRIATNVGLKRRRRRRWLFVRSEEVLARQPDDRPGPEAVAADREERDRVARAVAALPEDLRSVVILRGFEGLPWEEIAKILDIGVSTAEARMARAKDQLRVLLGRPNESDDVRERTKT
jgi:RNA polymerase sigma-70 factor (ECF subfamily)